MVMAHALTLLLEVVRVQARLFRSVALLQLVLLTCGLQIKDAFQNYPISSLKRFGCNRGAGVSFEDNRYCYMLKRGVIDLLVNPAPDQVHWYAVVTFTGQSDAGQFYALLCGS